MAPLCTVPLMYTKPDKLPKRKPTGLKIIDTLTKADYDWINNLEGKIRGYVRPQEWMFWKSSDRYKIYLFKDRGKRVGYSMTGTHGELAPAGAVSKKHLVNIVYEMLYLSNVRDDNTIRLFCPTHNIELYKMLLKNGLRMDEMLIFMSDTPYGDFDRYLPATLAIF
ncbi:MAG: hypothetical protein GY839_16025 [candidate division Zixibacteria bacterium]|nr:hypothetical protein [candidate division Zixibacteria bacterium]